MLGREGANTRIFKYQIINTNNNTATACLNQCAAFGFPVGAMEYGEECCEYFSPIAETLRNQSVFQSSPLARNHACSILNTTSWSIDPFADGTV